MNSLQTKQGTKVKPKRMTAVVKATSKAQSGAGWLQEEPLRAKQALIPYYTTLSKYYKGEMLDLEPEVWRDLWAALRREHDSFEDAFKVMTQAEDRDYRELPYEFNRLFIGPGPLLAPPYESSYRNKESLVMQEETLTVREDYREAQLRLVFANQEPDDFLGYELEFLETLLSRSARDQDAYEMYSRFWRRHLALWADEHCSDVLRHSQNKICRGMAMILQGLTRQERRCTP